MNEAKVRMLKMEPIRVRCRSCGKEIKACAGKSVCCGCSNMTTIKGNVISAVDMAKVIMLNTYNPVDIDTRNSLTESGLEWQEKRNKRKVRKLDFEDRSFR